MRRKLYKAERIGEEYVYVTDPRHSQHEQAKAEQRQDEFKFRDRDHVIEKLVGQDATAARHEWEWRQFLDRLDKAGYAIVRKHVRDGRGLSAAQKNPPS